VTVLLGSVDPAQLAALVILQVGYLVFGTILRASVPSILTAFIASALLSSGFVAFFINNQPVTQTLLPLLITGVGLTALGYISHRSLQAQFALRLKADQRASIYAMERDSANQEILAKNQFLSAASHDLKQPVHAIGLFAGLLEMKLNTPDTKGLLGKIQCSTDALSSLFDAILDISRLDAKAMEHDPQHIVRFRPAGASSHESGQQCDQVYRHRLNNGLDQARARAAVFVDIGYRPWNCPRSDRKDIH